MDRPRDWLDLLDALYAGSWNPSLGRFRSPYAFRGSTAADADLSNGLLRLSDGRVDVARLETNLLRNFRKYAYGHAKTDSVWDWLALGQHRGLPTRLVDWTYSPFVALHFATWNVTRMNEDGVVWAFDFVAANRYLPARLRRMLQQEGSDTFTVEMLSRVGTLRDFDRLARHPFVVFMEPPSLDPRIVNQFALFSAMSSPSARLDDWLPAHRGLARRIVIPSALKWEIRDKLDQANVNERVLFPGLDGLSRWLARYYWPNPARRGAERAGRSGGAGRTRSGVRRGPARR